MRLNFTMAEEAALTCSIETLGAVLSEALENIHARSKDRAAV
jgi:hypothetical protein